MTVMYETWNLTDFECKKIKYDKVNNKSLKGHRADYCPSKLIVNLGFDTVINVFLGVKIFSVTLSAMCYLYTNTCQIHVLNYRLCALLGTDGVYTCTRRVEIRKYVKCFVR